MDSSITQQQQPQQEIPKIVYLSEISKIVETKKFQSNLIQALSTGFVALEQGEFYSAPIQTLGAPPMAPFLENVPGYAGQTCVKSGYFRNNPYYVIKVASGGHPIPNSGLMQLFSQSTGRLVALLLDEGILTELRTAAVGALAAQLFGPTTIQSIGILGTGVQARYQLKLLSSVTSCRTVVVWGRSPEKAKTFQQEMEGWEISIAENADDLLNLCDLIVTTTCAREPVLGTTIDESSSSIRTKLITCIGADAPGKQELSPSLIAKASFKVADSLDQTRTRGEFQQYCVSHPNDLVSLGYAISEPALQRQPDKDDRLVIFDSSGVSLQDCAIAQMVFENLEP